MIREQAGEQLNIINSDGDIIRVGNRLTYYPVLDGQPQYQGRTGFAMPTFNVNTLPIWIDGGSILQSVITKDRNLYLPLAISKCPHVDLMDTINALKTHINPLKGEVTLEHVREDEDTRFITCLYKSGIDKLKDYGEYAFLPMYFTAYDPYWKAGTASTLLLVGTAIAEFFPFLFPFVLSADNVWDTVTENNGGDVETYPKFVCTGPGTSWEFRNNTSGKKFKIDYTLAPGAQMVISFDPRRTVKIAEDAGGANLFSYIDQTKMDAWPILSGNNNLEFIIVGTTGATQMLMTYNERYL